MLRWDDVPILLSRQLFMCCFNSVALGMALVVAFVVRFASHLAGVSQVINVQMLSCATAIFQTIH
jgi:hypothetical protein